MSWTQPQCQRCWNRENPDRQAHKVADKYIDQEICCTCGEATKDRIYVRKDPKTVPYPSTD